MTAIDDKRLIQSGRRAATDKHRDYIMIRIFASAASAITLLVALPVAAQDVPTVKVVYTDLDLSHAAGAAILQHRVNRAITSVCGIPDASDLDAVRTSSTCRRRAVASSSIQVAAVVAKAQQVAQRSTGAEVASR